MKNLIESLRFQGRYATESQRDGALRKISEREDAADEIERLHDEVKQAMTFINSICDACGPYADLNGHRIVSSAYKVLEQIRNDNDYAGNAFDLIQHLHRQRKFSKKTFGPGQRTDGVLDHIRKELDEIKKAPDDCEEWIDIVLLALDGAWRAGHSPEKIASTLGGKQKKNEGRSWPDWRTVKPGKAIEHVRITPSVKKDTKP